MLLACGGYVDSSELWVCEKCGNSVYYSVPDTVYLLRDGSARCGDGGLHRAVRMDNCKGKI